MISLQELLISIFWDTFSCFSIIFCGYFLVHGKGTSNENTQCMFSWRNKKDTECITWSRLAPVSSDLVASDLGLCSFLSDWGLHCLLRPACPRY